MLRLLLFWQKKGTNRPGWAVGPHGAVRPDSKGMVTGSKPAVRHRFRAPQQLFTALRRTTLAHTLVKRMQDSGR